MCTVITELVKKCIESYFFNIPEISGHVLRRENLTHRLERDEDRRYRRPASRGIPYILYIKGAF